MRLADTWASIVKKVANSKNSPINKLMIDEAEKLKDCIQYYLDIFYHNHTGINSTGELYRSLSAEDVVKFDNGRLSIKVYFEDDDAWGKSWLSGYDGALKPYIAAYGFKDKSNTEYTFEGFQGYNFIEMGIKKYEAESKYGLKVLLTLPTDQNDIWR